LSTKYLWIWPLANLRRNGWSTGISALAIALASFVVLSLSGFVKSYQSTVQEDIDGLGYDLLITARGCPYEAATLMLRGGVGMRYMPESVLAEIQADDRVQDVFPALVHPVRDPASAEGVLLFRGMAPRAFESQGLVFREGRAFQKASRGIVLGREIAELEQLRIGDRFFLEQGLNYPEQSLEVVGILERSGGQHDGSIMMSIDELQDLFSLDGKLTGVGVQLNGLGRQNLAAMQEQYEANPELQVVHLSRVVERFQLATDRMRAMVVQAGGLVALLCFSLLLSAALLRASGEQSQLFVLHAMGLSSWFLFLCSVVEGLVLVVAGVLLGVLVTLVAGAGFTEMLVGEATYMPADIEVLVDAAAICWAFGVGLLFSVLVALPRMLRLWGAKPHDLRGL